MAETAPLTAAHLHARKAAEQTHLIHWTEAADEHERAATSFARVARHTSDGEALRILNLLEAQHQQLARIIRTEDVAPTAASPTNEPVQAETRPAQKDTGGRNEGDREAGHNANATSSAVAAARLGRQVRDSSPSLARDIASRRGIPTPAHGQPSAAAQARARQLSPESRRRSKPSTPATPKVPPSIVDSQAQLDQSRRVKRSDDNEGFAKFFSDLTTGTMSKLPSVLAYAGMPLSPEPEDQQEQPKPFRSAKASGKTVKANNEPDINKLVSRAALTAIEDSHRQQSNINAGHQLFGPAESFYVVQKGGGTFSYADIAKAHQQQQRQWTGIDQEDDEAFVDAREAQAPSSPRHGRHPSRTETRNSFGKQRTGEELELENTTLKQTLEQLAGRLADFERHAMDANMEALNQSMLSMRSGPPPPVSPAQMTAATDHVLKEKLKILEQQVEKQTEERQKQDALVAKQKEQIKKYHAKWEEIRSSAKERRKREKEKSGAAADDTAPSEAPATPS